MCRWPGRPRPLCARLPRPVAVVAVARCRGRTSCRRSRAPHTRISGRLRAAAARIIIGGVPPTAFTTAEPLTDDELRAAGPPRYPRPSRLATPLEVTPGQGRRRGRAARAGDGRRPARAPPARPPERAHDRRAGDGRGRDRDRRGPLDHQPPRAQARDEAARDRRRRRRDRHDGGDVLQPAVAAAQVRARHAAAAERQVPGPQPLPRAVPRRDGRGGRRRRGGHGDLPGHGRALDDADPRAGAPVARRRAGVDGAAARAAARDRAAARPRRGARRRALRRPRGRPAPARLRGAAARADRAAAPPRAAPGGRARRAAGAAGRADRAPGWRTRCRSRPPATSAPRWPWSTTTSPTTARCSGC